MINFAEYVLTEAAGKPLQASTSNIKTKGHIKRYIFPFLSDKQKQQSLYDLGAGNFFTEKDVKDSKEKEHGSHYDPDANFTHTMASSHGQHKKGTPIRVTGVYRNGSTIMVRTQDHGDMPISKLGTPGELAASNQTEKGFSTEEILQKNLDPSRKPAGSTKGSYDFAAGDTNTEKSIRGKSIKSLETPFFRGESKASKKGTVSMGTSELVWNPNERKWSVTNPQVSNSFSKATVNGVPLLDYLNKHHSDGVIEKGFSADAAPGTASEYLKNGNVNALHLHRYKQDKDGNLISEHGTTFTVGDNNPFANRLGIGHLSEDDLLKFDNKINISNSRPGKQGNYTATAKHRPSAKAFNQHADLSIKDPSNHLDLHREDHGNTIRNNFNNVVSELQQSEEGRNRLASSVFGKYAPMMASNRAAQPPPQSISPAPPTQPAPSPELQQQDHARWADEGGGAAIGSRKSGLEGMHGGFNFKGPSE